MHREEGEARRWTAKCPTFLTCLPPVPSLQPAHLSEVVRALTEEKFRGEKLGARHHRPGAAGTKTGVSTGPKGQLERMQRGGRRGSAGGVGGGPQEGEEGVVWDLGRRQRGGSKLRLGPPRHAPAGGEKKAREGREHPRRPPFKKASWPADRQVQRPRTGQNRPFGRCCARANPTPATGAKTRRKPPFWAQEHPARAILGVTVGLSLLACLEDWAPGSGHALTPHESALSEGCLAALLDDVVAWAPGPPISAS